MVHSGSASPMTTTPSASPQLTVPAPAPPLQALPLLDPPLPTTTDQDLTQTPAKLLTPALTTSSGSTQPCTPTPSEVEPPTLNPGKALSTNSDLASIQSPVQTPVPTQNLVNGRSSGRKRTPKACDCCGPNSKGHDVKTLGRGRGKGRGRGAGRDVGDTSKRKGVRSQLTRIKKFDLTEEEEEGEDTDDEFEKVQNTHAVNIAESQAPVDLPITFSNQDGPMRNCVAQEGAGAQKDSVINKQEGAGVRKGGEKSEEAGVRLQGTRGRGVLLGRGRGEKGMMVATDASNIEMKVGEKRGGGAVISPETLARAGSMSKQRPNEEEAGTEMEQGEHTDSGLATSSPGNGLNPSGGGTSRGGEEAEVKADDVNPIGTGNGLFVSGQSPGSTSTSGNAQNPDSEMQVDQDPAATVPVWTPGNMSNGDITAPADKNHGSTCVESCILVCTTQHRWALRDHRLYCQPGTWKKDEEEEEGGVVAGKELSGQRDGWETDGQTQDKDSQEPLTEMIHDFLESFYMKYGSFIPLSETDVLEYLKKKGNSDLNNRKLDIPGEVRRYRAGLASVPVAGFMVSYNKHTLSLEDLGTLEEQNWLNDQVINMYGELIMEATQHKVHFFNSFFHKQLAAKGYEGVKRWTKKVDLFSKWLLLVPIHLEIHWSLITVDMATKTISYYDSQGIVFKHTIDNIMKYLQSEAREKKQTAYQKGWRMVIIKGIPQQKNDSDCGVFVLEYCRRLSVKQPLRFSQEDMPHIRKRIYKELCDCRLSD